MYALFPLKQLIMAQKIICFLFVFVSLSCQSSDRYYQGILNDLQGTYSIDSVVYINQAGEDSVLTSVGEFHFAACDADDNFSSKICQGFYTVTNQQVDFKFQLIEDDQFTLTPNSEDLPAALGIQIGVVSFVQSESTLNLTFFPYEQYELYYEEGEPHQIVLTKQ